MSGTVRLTRRAGETLLRLADAALSEHPLRWGMLERLRRDELASALRPSEKKRNSKKRNAAEKKTARQRHNEETAEIRWRVCERAGGWCENRDCHQKLAETVAWVGHQGEDGHLDHFRGRGKAPQSVVNTWMLCGVCDLAKTENRPDRATWLARYELHCRTHGYHHEAAWARRQWETEMIGKTLDAMTRGGGNT